jgi:four helix bundle protein
MKSFRELIVWQKSMSLVIRVYELTNRFPEKEKFGLVSQINRAAVSVPSNLAEGWGRYSRKEFLNFLYIARGSLAELKTQLEISEKLGYLDQQNYTDIEAQADELSRTLSGLIKSLRGIGEPSLR